MKKALFCIILSAALLVSSNAYSQNFMIGINLGFGYANNSQLNDAVDGYGDYTAAQLNVANSTTVFEGDTDKAGLAWAFDLDCRIFIGNIGIGAEIGYHQAGEAKSTAKADGYQSEQYLSLKIDAVPFLVTAYYRIDQSEQLKFLLGGGVGYYYSKVTQTEEAKGFVTGNFKKEITGSGNGYGIHAKGEVDYLMGPVALFGGLMLRYAKISKFTFDGDYPEGNAKKGDTLYVRNKEGGYDKLEGSFTGFLIYFGAALAI